VSPKASLVVTPLEPLDLYLNFGSGFHSNDARSVVASGGAGALPRALGYELGLRARVLEGKLELSAALWRLDLQSELVWNGDEGTTEAGGATTRQGVDLGGRWEILPWLDADLDVSLAKSRYKVNSGNGDAVALAPPRIVTGGLTARHPSGVQASLRFRHIGPRPASQLTAADGVPACTPALAADARCYLVADGYTVLDAALAFVARRFSVSLMAENLTDAVYREAQFGNLSQVIAPPPGAGAGFAPETQPHQDLHFTPGNPLGLQLAVSTSF
ncbi:MAG TPA: TonB-dependent receptor, partial [Myxococcales bacterium]